MISHSDRRKAYQFDKLTVGKSFVIPAFQSELFNHCRCAVSEWNNSNGTSIKTRKQPDGSLLVIHPLPEQSPTRKEFDAYLAIMKSGEAFKVGVEFSARFEEFKLWCDQFKGATILASEDTPGILLIRRQ